MEVIVIGIGDYKVAKDNGLMESISLGSCVGIALYDPGTRIAGLAHIMLPSSENACIASTGKSSAAKFADSAIRNMLEAMQKMGAHRLRIVAKIAGGACMFESVVPDPAMNVGTRNVEAVKKILEEERIPLIAEDTGKNYGRTLQFDVETGRLTIRVAKIGIKTL